MKYISSVLFTWKPLKILVSFLLAAVVFFAVSSPALAVKSSLYKGTVQLDKIEQKAQEAVNSPAMSLETIEDRSQGALNEVQGDGADRNKMRTSKDTTLPVVKKIEENMKKMKNK